MAPRQAKPVDEAIGDIDAQIIRLQEKKKDIIKKRSERIAKLVSESGLGELNISDDALLAALKELQMRFRGAATSSSGSSPAQKSQPHSSS